MLRFLLFMLTAAALVAQVPQATDAQIEAQLHDRLAKSLIGKDAIAAKVKGGVVTWEGTTPVAQHKGAATRMAKSSGARRVVNNIKVKKAVGAAAPVKKAAAAAPNVLVPAAPPENTPPLRRVTVHWRELRP